MTDKPLWSDDKINSLTFKNANNLDPDACWMHEQIVKDMRDDYERAIALRNQASMQAAESIKDLLGRITELERQGEKREAELIKQVDIVIDLQQYITELEQRRADLAADIPVIAHNAELPQFDPVWVRTLWQAYSELQESLKVVEAAIVWAGKRDDPIAASANLDDYAATCEALYQAVRKVTP